MLTITRDDPAFRPVTIRIESQDDLDKLHAIVEGVAEKRINYPPQVVAAAYTILCQLNTIDQGE